MYVNSFDERCLNVLTAPIPMVINDLMRSSHDRSAMAVELNEYAATLPRRVIELDGDVYLTRYAVHEPECGERVYLHKIHRPDRDLELHDHPWEFVAHVLVGGYIEQRWQGGERVNIFRQPGTNYYCDDKTYHRIAELLAPECWTLVITAPKTKSWSFWMPETGVTTPWREFVAASDRHIKAASSATVSDGHNAIL